MTDNKHCLPADAEQDKPGEGMLIYLPDRVARWQTQSRCKFTLLVNCKVAINDKLCHEFDSPVPVQFQMWLAEPVTKQHTLLSMLGCDSDAFLAALQHAQRVTAVQDGTVTVVLTTAQRHRLKSLHLTTSAQMLGRVPRGSELYRAAVQKQKLSTVSVAYCTTCNDAQYHYTASQCLSRACRWKTCEHPAGHGRFRLPDLRGAGCEPEASEGAFMRGEVA